MTFNAHRVWMQNFIIAEKMEHLSPVTTVYDTQISQKLQIEYELHRKKLCLLGSRPGQIQTKVSNNREW